MRFQNYILVICIAFLVFSLIGMVNAEDPIPINADHLWNVRLDPGDYFDSNEYWLRPWRTSIDDGYGQMVAITGYGYTPFDIYYDTGPLVQSSINTGTVSWTTSPGGDFSVQYAQDHQIHAWTYLYVNEATTIVLPAYNAGGGVPRLFLNYDFDTPLDRTSGDVVLNLHPGINRLDFTVYDQNEGHAYHLGLDLANSVEWMNSDPNGAPLFNWIGSKTVNVGERLTFLVSASDTEPVTIGVLNLPTGAQFESNTFTWRPNYQQTGTYKIIFFATDGINTVYQDVPITVENKEKIAFVSNRDGNDEIYVMNADGSRVRRLTQNSVADSNPALSPDGSKILFASNYDDINVIDIDGTDLIQLASRRGASNPEWSPDGSKIAFVENVFPNKQRLVVMNACGSGELKEIGYGGEDRRIRSLAWAPDGTKIAYIRASAQYGRIFIVNTADGSVLNEISVEAGGSLRALAWSPDGSTIAYTSDFKVGDGSYHQGISLMTMGGVFLIHLTDQDENYPAWSPDGSKIVFTRDQIYIMNADGSNPTPLASEGNQPMWGSATSPSPQSPTCVEGDSFDYSVTSDSGTMRYTDSVCCKMWEFIRILPSSSSLTITEDDPRIETKVEDGILYARINNMPPTVNIGGPYTETVGVPIRFSPIPCDIESDPLLFYWDFNNDGSWDVSESTSSEAENTWNAEYAGSVILGISDGYSLEKFTIPVTVTSNAPIVEAGPDQIVNMGDSVSFSGSINGGEPADMYTSGWDFGDGTTESGSLTLTHIYSTKGDYTVTLTVTDENGLATSDTLMVTVNNRAPVADAGPDQVLSKIGQVVTLDGSQSYDEDGDPLTYQWTLFSIPSGSAAALTGSTTATPTFKSDKNGEYKVQLVVNDGTLSSEVDTVTLSFLNVKPVADAGLSQSLIVGETGTLDGSQSSDANGDALTYHWSLVEVPAGSTSQILNPTAPQSTYKPDLPGSYTIQLVVNDGIVNSDPGTIQIQVIAMETKIITDIQKVETDITEFPLETFKNENMQNTLINKLNAVIADIGSSNYQDALNKIQNDILKKTDGCAISGAPDKNDWIMDCGDQNVIYPEMLSIINRLEGL